MKKKTQVFACKNEYYTKRSVRLRIVFNFKNFARQLAKVSSVPVFGF